MSSDVPQILAAAMGLPDTDRLTIAFQLLGSLKPPGILDAQNPSFASELERRVAAYDSGKCEAASLEEVDTRIHNALANKNNT